MSWLFLRQSSNVLSEEDSRRVDFNEPVDMKKVIGAIDAMRGTTSTTPPLPQSFFMAMADNNKNMLLQSGACLVAEPHMMPPLAYAPQQPPAFTPNVCYICNRQLAHKLEGLFQLTGCMKNHHIKNGEFSVSHLECYNTYLSNARQGKVQCRLCDSENKQ